MAVCIWLWIREHPWQFITGLILVLSAIGGLIKWRYEFSKLRRENKITKRESEIAKYVKEIEALDLKTPGGLRSAVQPGKGDDPELVAEAWRRYVQSKTRGNVRGRFDR
jgi:hypothetical protein